MSFKSTEAKSTIEIIEAIVAHLRPSGSVEFNQDGVDYYIDVSLCEEIKNEYEATIKQLEDKYRNQLQTILAKLESDESAPPSAKSKKAKAKRSAQQSSSTKNAIQQQARTDTNEAVTSSTEPVVASSTKTSVRTRSQARKAASASSTNNTATTGVMPNSSGRITRSRKVQQAISDQAISSSASKLQSRSSQRDVNHKTTPLKNSSINMSGSERSIYHCQADRAAEIQLNLSAEKIKKAGENKRIVLETRTQHLKEDREKRFDKFKQNKTAIEQQRLAKATESFTAGQASSMQMTKKELRNAERRRKLAEIEANEPNASKKGAVAKEPLSLQPEHQPAPKVSKIALTGIGIRLNFDEFSSTAAGTSGTSGTATSSIPIPTPSKETEHIAKKLIDEKAPTSYEMTPPPRECTFNNYDITKYIDSDDEEEEQAVQEAGRKRIPKWAQGRDYLKRIHAQFGKPAEELAAIRALIFPPPVLPMPLEEMGLPVREKYQVRTSSVNWKQAEVIADAVAKLSKKDSSTSM